MNRILCNREISHLRLMMLLNCVFIILIFVTPAWAGGVSGKVVNVTDGDTLDIVVKGKVYTVRLIGIDAPESHDNAKARNDAANEGVSLSAIISMGNQATTHMEYLVNLCSGNVLLEFDKQLQDPYGRLLAYVYPATGENRTMLNEAMVGLGYALPVVYPPNTLYKDLFEQALAYAQSRGNGFWSASAGNTGSSNSQMNTISPYSMSNPNASEDLAASNAAIAASKAASANFQAQSEQEKQALSYLQYGGQHTAGLGGGGTSGTNISLPSFGNDNAAGSSEVDTWNSPYSEEAVNNPVQYYQSTGQQARIRTENGDLIWNPATGNFEFGTPP